jgi:two-component system, OmpR family, sensor histidine kinase CiaH
MFTAARFKLTAWYLLIIMVISGLFSIFVYRSLTLEISRGLRMQALRSLPRDLLDNINPPILADLDDQVFAEARQRVAVDLAIINAGILVLSGISAYFLAGKTLRPIETMVEDQKRFISDASHELRTPLTAMKTEIEVALRGKQLDLRQARSLLDSNLEEVNKMQSLSNYLLALNRYQDSGFSLALASTHLQEVTSKAVASVNPLAEKKNILINTTGPDVVLKANSTSLVELVTLLLDNAIKYSSKNSRINIITATEPRHVLLSVQDYGIGIKAGDLPYIFNRFYRADASRNKSQVDGYGLGLSIAKNIVDLHHGQISVTSLPGEGTTFVIKLPLSNPS